MVELVAIMPISRKPRCVNISRRFGIGLGQSSNSQLANEVLRVRGLLAAEEQDLGYSTL